MTGKPGPRHVHNWVFDHFEEDRNWLYAIYVCECGKTRYNAERK